jgi:hypothetical protein
MLDQHTHTGSGERRVDCLSVGLSTKINGKVPLTQESKQRGQSAVPDRGYGNKVVNGVLLGIVLQLLTLWTRIDGLGVIAGIILFAAGILWRRVPEKSLPPAPSDEDYRRYKIETSNRKILARIDFAAWGGAMILVEAAALILYFLFGFHLPAAPGVD